MHESSGLSVAMCAGYQVRCGKPALLNAATVVSSQFEARPTQRSAAPCFCHSLIRNASDVRRQPFRKDPLIVQSTLPRTFAARRQTEPPRERRLRACSRYVLDGSIYDAANLSSISLGGQASGGLRRPCDCAATEPINTSSDESAAFSRWMHRSARSALFFRRTIPGHVNGEVPVSPTSTARPSTVSHAGHIPEAPGSLVRDLTDHSCLRRLGDPMTISAALYRHVASRAPFGRAFHRNDPSFCFCKCVAASYRSTDQSNAPR
jgi:hypothetical protein